MKLPSVPNQPLKANLELGLCLRSQCLKLHGKSLRFILYSYSELLICYSRNLCAIEWAQQNPKGLKSNFDTYYKALLEDQK